jgi:hypothetical protein
MSESDECLPPEAVAVTALIDEIRRIVEFHVREYDMHHASVIGALELIKAEVTEGWLFDEDNDEDYDDASG